jgi:hypothetical protein
MVEGKRQRARERDRGAEARDITSLRGTLQFLEEEGDLLTIRGEVDLSRWLSEGEIAWARSLQNEYARFLAEIRS